MNTHPQTGKSYWFDLPAADIVDARSFYEGLFNWQFLLMKDPGLSDYWVIQAGDELIGGLRKTSPAQPSSASPILYFTVPDLKAYAQRIKDLGGALVGNPVDLGENRGSYQWFRDREKNLLAIWAPSKDNK